MTIEVRECSRLHVPPGWCGDWAVLHRVRGESQQFTSLTNISEDLEYMTDLPHEWDQHEAAARRAIELGGDILVTGLGLGMFCGMIAGEPSIKSITVIEKSHDVIQLVGPHVHEKVTIICADAMEFSPVRKFSFAWHDIWPHPPTNEQQSEIMNHYKSVCSEQRCWTGV